MQDLLEEFLILNGFKHSDRALSWMDNDKCGVAINRLYSYFTVIFDGGILRSVSCDIFWLIGVLTYYELIPMNFKRLDGDKWNELINIEPNELKRN